MYRDDKGKFISKEEWNNRQGPYVNDVENEKTSTRNLVGILFGIVITVTFLIGMVYPI